MKTLNEYKLTYALTSSVTPENESEQLIYTLIDECANDKNSSKFREDVTKLMIGLHPSESKLGYDDDFAAIEVKPINYTGKKKLDGKGNFSDFTWARHRKYLKDNVRMIVSGFNQGKLLYIVEFSYESLKNRIEDTLSKKLPNGDVKGTYVRNAAFSYLHWINHHHIIHYVHPQIRQYKNIFNRKFLNALITQTRDDNRFFK